MTQILLLATIVIGVLLHDTRRRLARMERLVASMASDSTIDSVPKFEPKSAPETQPAPELARGATEAAASLPQRAPVAARIDHSAEPVPVTKAKAPAPAAPIVPDHAAELASDALIHQVLEPETAGFGIEDLFGRKLPIWAGGITLIVAAVLMVKYSIDTGLLSPLVRIALGFTFSLALISGAELARQREDFVRDVRVAQALAGAGIGGLYAATLAATNLYGLIGPGLAFAGLSAITGLALGLALRFGAPCAVLGLLGGLATPAVVQSDNPSVPLLAGYLAVLVGAITLLSRRQRWVWLGVSALVGGAGWSLLTLVMGGLDNGSTLSMGLLVMLLGFGLPAMMNEGEATSILRPAAAIVGALQLAVLVANGHFAPLTWGLYGLLSLAFCWLADSTPAMRRTVAVPLLTALGLTALWPAPDGGLFAAVIAGIAAIYGGYALRQLWRAGGSLGEVGQLAAISLGGYAICGARFYEPAMGKDLRFAFLALAFAALPALGAALGWRRAERLNDARFALLACCAGVLLIAAGLIGLPQWLALVVFPTIAAGLLGLAVVGRDERLARGALGFLAMAVAALAISATNGELTRLVETAAVPNLGRALLHWGSATLGAAAFAWRNAGSRLRFGLQPLTTLLGYGFVAQLVPAPWLAVATAAALVLLAEANNRRPGLTLEAALATLGVVLALWTAEPLFHWLVAAAMSLIGQPVLVTDLPDPAMALRRLVAPTAAGAYALWASRSRLPDQVAVIGTAMVGVVALVSGHILFKQLFAIDGLEPFVRCGLGERCLWEAALIAVGIAIWRWLGAREIALAFVVAALAHGIFYTLMLHNPLWADQAVGPWPLINLLLPAFGVPFVVPGLMDRIVPEWTRSFRIPADLVRMVTILLFAFATLRQFFAGTMLGSHNVGAVENIGRSVLAIALAIGFLGWGIRQRLRIWRFASLALMLAAVGKVFLLDASGLDGLLRILSFLALGFSLIGIGWLYSRYLKPEGSA
ncbi:DUF2339 domain-containing protein [Novosphingobium sp. BL-8H]|uniref:DUF2339 domain-containing protein n=1 Tax=Novosphingobium sp. BL-8H TaxID=3127640 RepID=UPI0037577B09